MSAISMPNNLTSRITKPELLWPNAARSPKTTLHLWETEQTQLSCPLQGNLVLTRKQAGWHDREKSIFPYYFVLKQFRCTACNSAICIGFGWDSFPYSSHPSAVLCIGSYKGVDNTPVFWPQLSRACTASRLAPQHSPLPTRRGLARS